MEGKSLKIQFVQIKMMRPFGKVDVLINLPVFCDNVILGANKELDRPNDKSKENVHPPPPYLRWMIQHCNPGSEWKATQTHKTYREVGSKPWWKSIDDTSGAHEWASTSVNNLRESCVTPVYTLTGQSVHPSSAPSSGSQVSTPIVGIIRDARCKIVRRYSKAMSTGFGNVLIIKFSRVWKCGYMFGSKGTLSQMWINGKGTRTMYNLLGSYWVGKGLLVKTTEPYIISQHDR